MRVNLIDRQRDAIRPKLEATMRTTSTSSMLKAKAIAGTHVVVLAWDLRPGQKSKLDGLMGFAIRRSEFDGNK